MEPRAEPKAEPKVEPKAEPKGHSDEPAHKKNLTALHDRLHEHHIDCEGGPAAACRCLFECPIFGGKPDTCSGKGGDNNETRHMVKSMIGKTIEHEKEACEGMTCIMRCAVRLKCLDSRVRNS